MGIIPPVMQSWARHVAKDAAFAAEYEDAYSVNLEQGRVAIADGVSSAIFSGRWARILTTQIAENPPELAEPDGWVNWLADPRRRWLEDIDFPRMPLHQKNKLRQVGGAYCTLCWIEVGIAPELESTDCCLLRAFAMGDSCVLHLRDGELNSSFPLTTSAEFDLDPDSICSVATSRDLQQQLKTIEVHCQDGDVLIMVTDAIGKWMLDCIEKGDLKPWERLWVLDEAEWLAAIEELRDTNLMKRDDTTMIALQIGEGAPLWEVARAAMEASAQEADSDLSEEAFIKFESVDDTADGAEEPVFNECDAGLSGESESESADRTEHDLPSAPAEAAPERAESDATLTVGDELVVDDENGPIGA